MFWLQKVEGERGCMALRKTSFSWWDFHIKIKFYLIYLILLWASCPGQCYPIVTLPFQFTHLNIVLLNCWSNLGWSLLFLWVWAWIAPPGDMCDLQPGWSVIHVVSVTRLKTTCFQDTTSSTFDLACLHSVTCMCQTSLCVAGVRYMYVHV